MYFWRINNSRCCLMTRDFSAIEFSKSGEATVLTRNYNIPPLKIINTSSHENACFCFLTNYGAGFVEGDEVKLQIIAHEHTESVITTQGNTRVYKSQGNACSQTIEAVLKKNAFHVFLNDPLVMHSKGSFVQKSIWTLEEDAVLLLVDWFSAGRVHNEEIFDFTYYQTETKIQVGAHPVLWDKFHIDPVHEDTSSPASFNSTTTYLNVFLAGNLHDVRVKHLENHFNVTVQKYIPNGNLDVASSAKQVIGNSTRVNEHAYFLRLVSTDVIYLQSVLSDLIKVLEEKPLLRFNPLRNRHNVQN